MTWTFCLVGTVATLLAACGKCKTGTEPQAGAPLIKQVCQVPEVLSSLSDAICSGDAKRIRDALRPLRTREVPESQREPTFNALRHIWEEDRDFGTRLPWSQLTDTKNKSLLVDVLAQAYRNHEADVSLSEMQKFAVDFVASGRDNDSTYYEGVWLLGVTDDTDEVPLLRRIALSDDPPPRRERAIEALGNICDPSAKQALNELSKRLANAEPYPTLIKQAMGFRAEIESSWCKKLTQ